MGTLTLPDALDVPPTVRWQAAEVSSLDPARPSHSGVDHNGQHIYFGTPDISLLLPTASYHREKQTVSCCDARVLAGCSNTPPVP